MKTKPRKLLDMQESACIRCRGTKMLCGKPRCPVLMQYYKRQETEPLIGKKILFGSSPPSLFIGRYGYPKVFAGPMIPPLTGDTYFMDTPELWHKRKIDDILDFRMKLVRGKHLIDVKNPEGKITEYTQEIAMAKKPVEMEVEFLKRPYGTVRLYDEAQPHGPSATIKKMWIANTNVDAKVEKLFYDESTASDAIISLYENGRYVSSIQKAFSAGLFGINKKFVPTRWSITAVDDILGKHALGKIKTFKWINEWRVYFTSNLDNLWVVILYPSSWQYELIEAWYPNTTWNPMGKKIVIFGDHEYYQGRTSYASIGGCYYAARLAISEKLTSEKRQAGAVILREIHPGYVMPVGVWNVRENVRDALKGTVRTFESVQKALLFVSSLLHIPMKQWIETSDLLKHVIFQKKIDDFYHDT